MSYYYFEKTQDSFWPCLHCLLLAGGATNESTGPSALLVFSAQQASQCSFVLSFCPKTYLASPLFSSWLLPSREATTVSQTWWLQLLCLLPLREEPWLGHCKVLPASHVTTISVGRRSWQALPTEGWIPLAECRRVRVIVPHLAAFLVRIFLKSLGAGSRLPGWP